MMNIPPDVTAGLSLHDYEALLYHWNEAHGRTDDIEAPDGETTMALLDKINSDPRLTHGAGPKARREVAA